MPKKNPDSHRLVTGQMTNKMYVAVCSCGFLTADKKNREDAIQEGFEHRIKALREDKLAR